MSDSAAGSGEQASSAGSGAASSAGSGAASSAGSIVAAAERLAAEITRNAESEAEAIRARAGSDSEATRAATVDRVRRLTAMADAMLEQLRALRAELDSLSGSLGGRRSEGGPGSEREPDGEAVSVPTGGASGIAPDPQDVPPAVAVPVPGHVQPVAAVPHPDEHPASAGAAASPVTEVDDAGARLIALNLALSDTPRDEAARQLRDQVPDAERLVDEVYASVDR